MTEGKKTVVCIEDEPEVIRLVAMILEPRGFALVGAVGGQEGLQMVRRIKPHLVLLDLMMPEMDGWEVYYRIKTDDELKHIPVIIVTVKASSRERALALQVAKVDDYVAKPFLVRDLLRSVCNVLDAQVHHSSDGKTQAGVLRGTI